ncbi:MAG: AAA family ATPase [Muribaculaceae bacterium]|nr:AAA family ATPase [Muribaculaceae bacterium]
MNANNGNNKPVQVNLNDVRVADFFSDVLEFLPYQPNAEQVEAIASFAHFYLYGGARSLYLLNGYAGTGKTSLIGAIVQTLTRFGIKVVLLAPTGRSAKVLSEYSHRAAWTIHRRIYRQDSYLGESFALAENKHTNTVFIVDEASMIANSSAEGSMFGSGRLLDDLVSYVYNGEGCKLMLMGDGAQLSPVGQSESPALDVNLLQSYGLFIYNVNLTLIARQASDSGILQNATIVRKILTSDEAVVPKLELTQYHDIESLSGEFLMETLNECYDRDGLEETIVITRSNKRAMLYNGGIRNMILYREDELTTGDMLIVSKNNYYWAKDYKEIDFIANGDVMRVKRVWGEVEQYYGLRFANVTVELPDHDNLEMDVKIILNSLFSETPALTVAQSNTLYNEVLNELTGDKRERYRQMKEHPYFNALQVKFAYAVTCHKAQGGQWRNVFVDMGSIMPEALSTVDFMPWLYTAITRATSKVYLINCPI